MNPNEYQQLAARTLLTKPEKKFTDKELMLSWCGLGLSGEAGEASDEIKKHVYHGHKLNKEKLRKELGDTQWYIAAICSTLGWSLEDIMQENVKKLEERYPDGFDRERSKNR